MSENITTKIDNKEKISKMIIRICIIFFIPLIVYAISRFFGGYNDYISHECRSFCREYGCVLNYFSGALDLGFQNIFCGVTTILFWVAVLGSVIAFLIFNNMKCEISVLENKLTGEMGFGKKIDILFDNISYLNKDGNKGIKLTTKTETVRLVFLNNRDEIYNIIRNIIGETKEEKELAEIMKNGYRKRCNVCGKIICYTLDDLKKNEQHRSSAKIAALTTAAGALSGNFAAGATSNQTANDELARIVDYTKCPSCGSRDLVDISDKELAEIKESQHAKAQSMQPLSSADELKKYKELLDEGTITQEEFDEKKKQLLGL